MKAILYNNELFDEFNSTEHREWEDLLDATVGRTAEERKNSEAWITYDFLMNRGYMVNEPKDPRPTPEASIPRVIPIDAPFTSMRREPEMSPSQLLQERERLLNTREKLMRDQLAFERRQFEASKRKLPKHRGSYDFKIYNKDGSELSILDIFKVGLLFFVICMGLSVIVC